MKVKEGLITADLGMPPFPFTQNVSSVNLLRCINDTDIDITYFGQQESLLILVNKIRLLSL